MNTDLEAGKAACGAVYQWTLMILLGANLMHSLGVGGGNGQHDDLVNFDFHMGFIKKAIQNFAIRVLKEKTGIFYYLWVCMILLLLSLMLFNSCCQ